ncbi:MAG: ribosome recycling factor [Flavobacteriales bacterium TMED191]|nr:MAG: ribosome recycling factor [Flavobacteriales bacterium TMED191]|tara:strand:- start:970 stop:1533 length:564 start_codon:yes stop_codon:yes gene_type:complete
MEENIKLIMDMATENMNESINHLQSELSKIRAGRANTSVLEGILIDYYGTPTPIHNMASLSTPDARTIVIQPWEKQLVSEIINGINSSNLGFVAQDTGEKIIINIPILTEERRKELVRQAKTEIENCKISIRNVRRDANDEFKKLNKDGLSDDQLHLAEEKIQVLTNTNVSKVDGIFEAKEKDILTV